MPSMGCGCDMPESFLISAWQWEGGRQFVGLRETCYHRFQRIFGEGKMKVFKSPPYQIASSFVLTIALCFVSPRVTYSVGSSGSGGIRSLSPGSTGEINEAFKPSESIEDQKAYELEEELDSQDIVARLNAALALGKIKGPEAVRVLIALLRNSPYSVMRFVAATSLGEIGDPEAVVPLIAALQDKDRSGAVQRAAATALAKIRDPRAIAPLVDRLWGENPDVRAAAARALGIFGDTKGVLPLIAALGDEDPFVRFYAARALGQLKHPLAVSPLAASLSDDRVSEVRWWAAHALGEIKDSRAIEPLANVVGTESRQPETPYIDVIEVEDSINPKEASPVPLIRSMHWSIQLEAIHSLGKMGEEALPALIATMSRHQDLDFREEAAREIIDVKCAQFMIQVLKEHRPLEREHRPLEREHRLLEVVKGVYTQVISTGESGTEDVLIAALDAYGQLNMARDFQESNNEKLERAALAWMRRNGHEALSKASGNSPQWGEKRKEDCQAGSEIGEEGTGAGCGEGEGETRGE